MTPLVLFISWMEDFKARGALDALTQEDQEIAQDLLEHLHNYDCLRTHHAPMEAELMRLRKELALQGDVGGHGRGSSGDDRGEM